MKVHINRRLYRLYFASPPEQQAVASLVAELERWELKAANPIEWRRFAREVVLELVLYGYCVYKLDRGVPRVLSGRFVELVYARGRHVPKLIDHPPVGPRTGWRVVVGLAPEYDSSGAYLHPRSAAYAAMPLAVRRVVLEENLIARDKANSQPTVYTRVSSNVVATAGATRPWFSHGNPLAADVSQRIDLDQLVRHRAETIAALDRVTDTALRRAPTNVLGEAPVDRVLAHREHAITDGRDLTEARTLEQSTVVVHHTLDRLAHEISFTLGVPPQVQGRNINSERMASSNRLNEQAITHFRATARRFKAHLDLIFALLGGARFTDKADAFALDRVGHLLKRERLAGLFALAYGLKTSDFDPAKLETAFAAPPPKKIKTDEDKLAAALKRNPNDG